MLCANLYLIMNELTLNLWCEFSVLVLCKKVLKLILYPFHNSDAAILSQRGREFDIHVGHVRCPYMGFGVTRVLGWH